MMGKLNVIAMYHDRLEQIADDLRREYMKKADKRDKLKIVSLMQEKERLKILVKEEVR